jgi:transketolase
MAIAERWLASYFNRPTFELFDYDVYGLCGDGCMMEGIFRRSGLPAQRQQTQGCGAVTCDSGY